jgi:hypothetical protein
LQWYIYSSFFPCIFILIEKWIVSLTVRYGIEHSSTSVWLTYLMWMYTVGYQDYLTSG